MKKIAVLLSIYRKDTLCYVKLAVESILNQTIDDFTFFVGVDGQVDEELFKYLNNQEVNNRINVRLFQVNHGLAYVLNMLLEECHESNFEYLARMDADDVALPDRFKKQLDYLEHHPEVDVVGGAIEEIDENGNLRGKTVHYPLTNEDCRKYFRFRDPLAHPAVMFRASFFEKVKSGYREEYRRNQDTMLWFDAIKNGCVFANLPDTILQYRVRKDYYRQRLGNWTLAKQILKIRMRINRELHYGLPSYLFAFAMFGMTILPTWMKRWLHKMR